MNEYEINFQGHDLVARKSGVLWWPAEKLLCVSDMHLGKSDRIARRSGALLPPFETKDTLSRLGDEILALRPETVVCLGDSFDELSVLDTMQEQDHKHLTSLIAGREWVWIEGNHDSGPVNLGGTHLRRYTREGLNFQHIADPQESAEISGHYHPKARINAKGRGLSRPCFLVDKTRIIMPAFGTYTGGLFSDHEALSRLMGSEVIAVLTGAKILAFPLG